jgi:hypothetical protein
MSPVSRETTAGRVYLDLQRLARSTKRPTDELLRTYVLERFLWRVGNSKHRDKLVLKGGMLMAVFAERRPTADVDLLALELSNDLEAVSFMVREVLAVEADDGVSYAIDQISVATIRDADVYPGVRVSVPARIDRARATLRVDVNVGDPVTPPPTAIQFPALLGEAFPVVGYPVEMVLAEKIVTMLDRGELNTRERDFADVILLIGQQSIDADVLTSAIDATINHRGSTRQPLAEAIGALGERRQANWQTFINSAGLGGSLPDSFREAIDRVVEFADPVVSDASAGQRWDHASRVWV